MKKALTILTMTMAFFACEKLPENTPTYGKAKVVADETLFPIVDALEKGYEHTYPKTSIEVTYLPEAAAFNAFYQDSAAVIVCARKLGEKEAAFFEGKKLNPRTGILANDAVAFLVNPASADTAISCGQMMAIFKGEITDWGQVEKSKRKGPITVVFDNQGSSTVSYVMGLAGRTSPLPNSYALKTTEATVDYIAKNEGAMGVVGYSWLSDYDDPKCRELRSKVRVVGIAPCDSVAGEFYKPFSANVQEKLYPFSRQVFAINRETSNGTGTGFVAFMAGEIGQRIISKSGILPAYKVEHNIELKSEPFKVKN